MAEVFRTVTIVLDLLPLCRDGLIIIRDVFNANPSLDLPVARLELQRERFDEWRDIWRTDDGHVDLEFEVYAKTHLSASKNVLDQLALLAQLLFDAHALENKYGIKPIQRPDRECKDLSRFRLKDGQQLTLETHATFLERCKANISFIKRCKFVFRKKDTPWNKLIDHVREFIETLSTYGPAAVISRLLKNELDIIRRMDLQQLRRLAEVAAYEARVSPSDSSEVQRYQSLSLAAQFSAVVKYERLHSACKFTMRDFRLDPSYAIAASARTATMALLFDYPVCKEHRVVLIEWIYGLGPDQERDTRIKTLMLATPKPDELLLPNCYGMVDDPVQHRFGLVLAPPTHISSNLPPILSAGAISQKRMPVSLRELLEKRHPACLHTLDLGIRFRLAKKLVAAVHAMHCVGWVHRNIRSSCVLFFPAANMPSRGPAGPVSGFPQAVGYDSPLLFGLGSTRASSDQAYYTRAGIGDSGGEASEDDEEIEEVFVDAMTGQKMLRRVCSAIGEGRMDWYQHPDKRRDPNVRYSRAYDIYSLGCILLEIGLWKPLDTCVDIYDEDFERVKKGFQACTMMLDGITGSVYANVVRRCLAISTGERSESETRSLWKFCAEIAAALDGCMA